MAITHVFCKVGEDCEHRGTPKSVPVHASVGSSATGGQLQCVTGKVYRLPWTTETRKRIRSGDLVLCTRDGGEVQEEHEASAPNAVELDESGAVTASPRVAGPAVAKFDTSDTKGA